MASVRHHQHSSFMQRLRKHGFTLLEVMVSLGILAVALMAIADLNGGAVRMHAYGRRLTVAVQLARGKMLDIQQLLQKEGLSDFSKEYHGDFEDEGWPEYKWVAKVIKPDFDINATNLLDKVGGSLGMNGSQGSGSSSSSSGSQGGLAGLLGSLGSSLGGLTGGAAPGGASSALPSAPTTAGGPLAALGPFAGVMDAQIKAITEQIKTSVREVKLTISWKAGSETESFDVVQHIVMLPDAQQNADLNAQAKTVQGATGAAAAINNAPGLQSGTNPLQGLTTMPQVQH